MTADRHDAGSLGRLVELEAKLAGWETRMRADPARLADGWTRRFIADAARAEEAIELYTALGYEVCADPVRADEIADECEGCRLLAALRFKTIYTRRGSSMKDDVNDRQ